MAKSGMKVLYVDADIRKPMPFKLFYEYQFKRSYQLYTGPGEAGGGNKQDRH